MKYGISIIVRGEDATTSVLNSVAEKPRSKERISRNGQLMNLNSTSLTNIGVGLLLQSKTLVPQLIETPTKRKGNNSEQRLRNLVM